MMIRYLWLLAITYSVESVIVNNRCSIFSFLPLWVDHEKQHETGITGEIAPPESGGEQGQVSGDQPSGTSESQPMAAGFLGFSHMAAGLLAVEHFNSRDSSIVSELADPFYHDECKIQLVNEVIIDSGELDHGAVQALWDSMLNNNTPAPCALAGPYWDLPGLELSVLATAQRLPLVVHRSFNTRLIYPLYSPYANVVYPSLEAGMQALVDFLHFTNRTNYISFLHAVSDGGIQTKDILEAAFQRLQMIASEHSYITSPYSGGQESNSILQAMRSLQKQGFKTIVVSTEFYGSEIPAIANAAAALGMLETGEYMWVWFGPFALEHEAGENTNVTQLLHGSFWIKPKENHLPGDPFFNLWRQLNATTVERLNAMNPMNKGSSGGFVAGPNFFQHQFPQPGSAFFYDAIMSIGIGACLANGTTSEQHLMGIQAANFQGATGNVHFGQDVLLASQFEGIGDSAILPGARKPSSVTWTAVNVVPKINSTEDGNVELHFVYPAIYNGTWVQTAPFIFANGRSSPPNIYQPDHHYLKPAVRALGLTLMGIAIATALAAMGWVYVNREHRVLLASQPIFLHVLAIGSIVTASAILTISFDEADGWSVVQLGRSCMATMWLITSGYIITYGALFSKLWRIDRVLQQSRRKVRARHAAWPACLLIVMALIILSVWTGVDPMVWVREVIDDSTGESIGRCEGEHFGKFFGPLVAIMLTTLFLTAFMAYKTKDVDDAYSESKWILVLIIVQFEVAIIGVPVEIVLRGSDANIRYIGLSFMLWLFSMSTLLLIFVPKYVSHRRVVRGSPQAVRGGAKGQVKVTGLEEQNDADVAVCHDPAAHSRITTASISTSNVERLELQEEEVRPADSN
jgi:hypothetical protein